MNLSLGGPGLACSVNRVRQFTAGELGSAEQARTAEHIAGCARCQASAREIEEERQALDQALPFQEFASGVAERLARPTVRRPRLPRMISMALAASLVIAVAVPLVLRLSAPGTEETRVKGSAAVVLYAQEGAQVRALAPGEPIPAGARLRLSLLPAGRRQAVVALVDADGVALLYAGPALSGPLPDAFEWIGPDRGTLMVMLADTPLDGKELTARMERAGTQAEPPAGTEVIRVPLIREVK